MPWALYARKTFLKGLFPETYYCDQQVCLYILRRVFQRMLRTKLELTYQSQITITTMLEKN